MEYEAYSGIAFNFEQVRQSCDAIDTGDLL